MFPPVRQVWMIYFPIPSDMLSRSYGHVLRRCDIAHRCFVGVGVRHPQCDWESICISSKVHRNGAIEQHQESRRSCLERWNDLSAYDFLSSSIYATHCRHRFEEQSRDSERGHGQGPSTFDSGRGIPTHYQPGFGGFEMLSYSLQDVV
jgi:hypothetical protein